MKIPINQKIYNKLIKIQQFLRILKNSNFHNIITRGEYNGQKSHSKGLT